MWNWKRVDKDLSGVRYRNGACIALSSARAQMVIILDLSRLLSVCLSVCLAQMHLRVGSCRQLTSPGSYCCFWSPLRTDPLMISATCRKSGSAAFGRRFLQPREPWNFSHPLNFLLLLRSQSRHLQGKSPKGSRSLPPLATQLRNQKVFDYAVLLRLGIFFSVSAHQSYHGAYCLLFSSFHSNSVFDRLSLFVGGVSGLSRNTLRFCLFRPPCFYKSRCLEIFPSPNSLEASNLGTLSHSTFSNYFSGLLSST